MLKKLRLTLLYAAPALLFFSYHPVITLAATSTMNFELSLPLIWLVLYDLISLADFARLAFQKGLKTTLRRGLSDAKFFLVALFPLYATISVLWSANPTRAIFTALLIWALFIAIFATYQLAPTLKTTKKLKHILYASTTAVCIFCWIQCALDLAGVDRSATLLCLGCTSKSFGFPHPNGFAIEPQFMGNLLLAPTITLLLSLLYHRLPKKSIPLMLFFTTTLFLTFSRGAIYAFLIAAAFAIIVTIIKRHSPRPLLVVPLLAAAFLSALLAQGLMAELSPTNDTFRQGIAKSIHQLSLGRLDFRAETGEASEATPPVENPVENSQPQPQPQPQPQQQSSTFDGYVAASTDIRLNLNTVALDTWRQNPENIITGVGLGGAGVAMYQAFPAALGTPKEIVQNQPISLLLETGLIGIIFLIAGLLIALQKLRRLRHDPARAPAALLFLTLSLAYFISLNFFSGLTNALHIYLTLAYVIIII